MLTSDMQQKRLVRLTRAIVVVVYIGSVLVLIGWATGNYALTRLVPYLGGALPFVGQLHSAAAINLIFLSIGLGLMTFRGNESIKKLSLVCSTAVILSSLVATYEDLAGESFEVMRILAPSPAAPGITYPTPMILEVSLTLLVLAIAQALLYIDSKRSITPAQIGAVASFPIPLLIFIGAATQSPKLCALGGCFEMSLAFSLLTLAMGAAIVFAKPDQGIAKLFASTTSGGSLCRRAALIVAFVPVLLILRTISVNYRYNEEVLIEEPLSWAIFGLVLISVIGYMVISGAKSMEDLESEREIMVDKLIQTEQALSDTQRPEFSQSVSPNTTVRYKKVCTVCTQEYDDMIDYCPIDSTKLDRVIDESLEGIVLADKYEVESLLGAGGMSIVYKAKHMDLNKYFAIKVLKGAAKADGLQRFKREAQATSSLNHKNIVDVTDYGIAEDGRSFLVMEYVEGESLADLLDRVGALSPKVGSYLLKQICDGLSFAHKSGVIHRDLKPANIMLVKSEDDGITAKIVDFGLAKIIDDGQGSNLQLTKTGECFGSPLYMSPEQCKTKDVDHRTDIYALGCIAYECFVGNPPFIGSGVIETINMHLKDTPPPFPPDVQIPDSWKQAIYIALSKKREQRQSDAKEIRKVIKMTSSSSRSAT